MMSNTRDRFNTPDDQQSYGTRAPNIKWFVIKELLTSPSPYAPVNPDGNSSEPPPPLPSTSPSQDYSVYSLYGYRGHAYDPKTGQEGTVDYYLVGSRKQSGGIVIALQPDNLTPITVKPGINADWLVVNIYLPQPFVKYTPLQPIDDDLNLAFDFLRFADPDPTN